MGVPKMATSRMKQEMPPSGGYGGIDWAAKGGRQRISGKGTFALMGLCVGVAWVGFAYERKMKVRAQLETMDARNALEPLYLAEQHRLMLRQLRQNRDDENELMKDRPDWETGKWKGKPLYHNIPGRFILPPSEEYFAHTHKMSAYERYYSWHYI